MCTKGAADIDVALARRAQSPHDAAVERQAASGDQHHHRFAHRRRMPQSLPAFIKDPGGQSHQRHGVVRIVAAAPGIGAIIGALAGGCGVVATRNKAVSLPTETKVSFRLSAPATITERLNQRRGQDSPPGLSRCRLEQSKPNQLNLTSLSWQSWRDHP
jgi:hypothetical protein